jgi:hypothetical protein
VHFGVGAATELNNAEIMWPSGRRQRLSRLKVDQVVDVTEPDR